MATSDHDSPNSRQESTRLGAAAIGWGLGFGLLCLYMVVVGLESALHFAGPAIDGPFQLYNSLRRIWVGQQAGVDFQFFHGMGIPYLHYMPFRLLGGTFFASEIVREMVSAVLYPATIVVVLWFFIRDWTRTLVWAAIVMMASIALHLTSMLVAINSLLGVRSTLPTLVPVALCLRTRSWIRTTAAGIALGGALVMGTEQGLAVGLAIGIATIVFAWRSPAAVRSRRIADGAIVLGLGAVTLVMVLMLLGGVDGMRGALNYNFRLVPLDQYWYFGAPPNAFLSSWGVIPTMMARLPRIPITILVGAAAAAITLRYLWRDAAAPRGREQFAFTVLALYGLISCASLLGTYVNAYLQPLQRADLLLGAIFLDRRLRRLDAARARPLVGGVSPSVALTAAVTFGLMVAAVPRIFETMRSTFPHMLIDHVIHRRGPAYTGMWPETIIAGQAILDSRRDAQGRPPVLWSTYAGLLEARNGLFNPSVDYVIHALGPAARAKYVADFHRIRPGLVQTVNPLYSQYEAWIEETSWDFYLELLQNYELIGRTPWSLFWSRRDSSAAPPRRVWSARIEPGFNAVQLPRTAGGGDSSLALYEVEIDYHVRNPLHALPIIGASPRYLIRAVNAVQREPVTLNPYVTTTRFPLVVTSGSTPELQWAVYALLPGASIEVTAVRLSLVQMSGRNAQWLLDLAAQQRGGLDP